MERKMMKPEMIRRDDLLMLVILTDRLDITSSVGDDDLAISFDDPTIFGKFSFLPMVNFF